MTLESKLVDSIENEISSFEKKIIRSIEKNSLCQHEVSIRVDNLQRQLKKEISKDVRSHIECLAKDVRKRDCYTHYAMPTVVYFGLVIVVANYLIAPFLFYLHSMEDVRPFDLPSGYWMAWGSIVSAWGLANRVDVKRFVKKYSVSPMIKKKDSEQTKDDSE